MFYRKILKNDEKKVEMKKLKKLRIGEIMN